MFYFVRGPGLPLRLTDQKACLFLEGCWKISWMYIFSYVVIQHWVVDPNVDGFPGFSGKLFSTLVHYFEVGDVSMVVVVWFTVNVNCTGYMNVTFLHSYFLDICWTHQCSNSKLGAKEALCTSMICCVDLFTPPKGMNYLDDSLVHTIPANCIPVFNSSTSVKFLFHNF